LHKKKIKKDSLTIKNRKFHVATEIRKPICWLLISWKAKSFKDSAVSIKFLIDRAVYCNFANLPDCDEHSKSFQNF